MKKNQTFSISNRLKSFKYAFNGLKILIKEEHNSRIHFLVAGLTVLLSFIFEISHLEWIAIIFAIGFVISMELINSAIENIADFISPEKHEAIKRIKDLSAAGVLIAAVTAFIIGIIVFVPKIFNLAFFLCN